MTTEYSQHSDSKSYISAITADFDRLFELGWKTLKEYLLKEKCMSEARTGSPKDILKLSFQQGIINNDTIWLQMLADRSDDTHYYNESSARTYVSRIERDYLKYMGDFINTLSAYIPEEKDALIEVPDDFITAVSLSGLYYDEFLKKVLEEYNYKSDLELFENWDSIKPKYLEDTNSISKLSKF